MKDKIVTFLIGLAIIAVAVFLAPILFDGRILLVLGFLPLNATVITWIGGIFGGLVALSVFLPDNKDKNK